MSSILHSFMCVSPNSLNTYSYDYNDIKSLNFTKLNKVESFISSFIYTKDIISSTIHISSSVAENDLVDVVENKVYEELGLDNAIEYTIYFQEVESNDQNSRAISVFAFNKELINNSFAEITNKTRYIDFITTPPFLLSVLYNRNTLDAVGVHCFIYLQNEIGRAHV